MKSGFGWYKEHGRFYNVTSCVNCGASITLTELQEKEIINKYNILTYLSNNITCCDDPYFTYDSL